ELRDPAELSSALCTHAMKEVRWDELPQRPADWRKAEARLRRDLNRCMRARNHHGESALPLSTREDIREAVNDVPRSRLPGLHRRTRSEGADARETSLRFLRHPWPRTSGGPGRAGPPSDGRAEPEARWGRRPPGSRGLRVRRRTGPSPP